MSAAERCLACERPIVWGFVDYSDTRGWVHEDSDEAKCDVDAEDSDDASPEHWDAAAKDASLGAGHDWTAVRCPAYRTLDPADCTCTEHN